MGASTLGRFIQLPTVGGAADFLRADQPLGSGVLHLLNSNIAHLAGENSLRHLGTWPGWWGVCTSAPYSSAATFDWNGRWDADDTSDPRDMSGSTEGTLILCTGPVRLRPHPPTGRLPRVEWKFRWRAWAGFEMGAIAVVAPVGTAPSAAWPYATTTTTNAAMTAGTLTVTLAQGFRGLSTEIVPALTPDERGTLPLVNCWLGIWGSTDDKAQPGRIAGISCYLREPV